MAFKSIFIGERSRCEIHSAPIGPQEELCPTCKIIQRNLSLRPPFDVISIRNFNGISEGERYKVMWVIKDGRSEYKDRLVGYVIRDIDTDLAHIYVYDADDFKPWEFLSHEEKEVWRKKHVKKEVEDQVFSESGMVMD